jgi:hypothetical protein
VGPDRFIDPALRHFVQAARRTRLRGLLQEGAVRQGERDRGKRLVRGIRPVDVPGFVVAQGIGGALAVAVVRWLLPPDPDAPDVR